MKHEDYIADLLRNPAIGLSKEDVSFLDFIGKEFQQMALIQRSGYSPRLSKSALIKSFEKFLDLPSYLIETYGEDAPDPQELEFMWAEDIWNLYFCEDVIN